MKNKAMECKVKNFDPRDESTWPKPFTWVITNLGIGMHCCLHDDKESTWNNWSFIRDNRSQPDFHLYTFQPETMEDDEWDEHERNFVECWINVPRFS